jgi:tryptophanyl-tRNA synthetase
LPCKRVIRLPEDFVVTPWVVSGDIDYDRLVERFGTQRVDDELVARMVNHTGEMHTMLRRGIFYSHRDMNLILDDFEKNRGFVMYTGRGPSGHTHIGHLMPWIFTKFLQDKFGVELYFQMTDDEKFMFGPELTMEDTRKFAYENALDVIALGFDRSKTKIFLDTEYSNMLYRIAVKVAKKVTFSTTKAVFGFTNSTNIGSIWFTSMQAAPAFLPSVLRGENVRCLIPCAIDQDPHFRVARDVAEGIGFYKPALIHCKMLPSLVGSDKMSASLPSTSIFTTDAPDVIKSKIGNAFTGGAVSVEEQRKNGGNPDVCSVYQYFYYIFEDSDEKLDDRWAKCRAGEVLCGECKQDLCTRVTDFIAAHQEKREKARDVIEDYMLRDCQGGRD